MIQKVHTKLIQPNDDWAPYLPLADAYKLGVLVLFAYTVVGEGECGLILLFWGLLEIFYLLFSIVRKTVSSIVDRRSVVIILAKSPALINSPLSCFMQISKSSSWPDRKA